MTVYLPTDGNGKPMQLSPAKTALARTVDATISSSTEITLQTGTKMIRVYAIDKDIYLKWGTADCAANNFDHVIPANQIVDLTIPPAITAVNFIERAATATLICIEF